MQRMTCYSYSIHGHRANRYVMPDFLRKSIGLLLIVAAVGVASCQALLVSCTPNAMVISSTLTR